MSGRRYSPFTLSDKFTDENFEFLTMDEIPNEQKPAQVEQALPVPRPPVPALRPLRKRLGALSKPSYAYYHPKTGLVHGRVSMLPRDRARLQTVHFVLQDENDKEDLSLHLVARKEKQRFFIYDASKGMDETWDLLATMERREFHNDAVSYALTTRVDKTLDACVFFNKPSLIQYALVGAPRQLELGVFTKAGRKLELEKASQVVKDCCKYSESKATSSSYKIVGDSKYLSVFQSVAPYKKEGRKKFGLNFQGRGHGSSNKNCQMESEIGKKTIQMCKVQKGVYHVDFAAPINAVQAFAFALAQLDL
eukprot:scaffold2143_cov154-Amphora_coffeaeformis.AAC.2